MHRYSYYDCCIKKSQNKIANLKLFVPIVRVAIQEETKTNRTWKVNLHLIPVSSRIVWSLAVEADLKSSPNDISNNGIWLIIWRCLDTYLFLEEKPYIFKINIEVVLFALIIEDLQVVVSAVHELLEGLIIEILIEFAILINDWINPFW